MGSALCVLGLLCAHAGASAWPGALSEPPKVSGCSLLPPDNVWNTPVDNLPIHPSSDVWVQQVGSSASLVGGGAAARSPVAEGSNDLLWYEITRPASTSDVTFRFAEESDPGPYPIPEQAVADLGGEAGSRRMIVLDSSRCVLYELDEVLAGQRGWSAAFGAVYPLRSNELRPSSRIPAERSGLPIFPGLLRFAELDGGEIRHALRFSAPAMADSFVWPARRASALGAQASPPVGQRFRLRGDLDVSQFSERVRVLLTALGRYGMILSELGEPWELTTAPDGRWTEAELGELATIRGSDFDAVDGSLLRVAEDSGRVRTQLEIQPFSSEGSGPFECVATPELACVGNDRFAVRVDWVDGEGTPTPARVGPVRSNDSVLFWFFEPTNWELMVKVVDGCVINGHHWVFFAGTTDRGFALTIADSRTGDRLVYSSPPGQPATAATDSDAFANCAL